MRQVYQRTGAAPGEAGDCFVACIASLLDLRLSDVPNFNAGLSNGELVSADAHGRMMTWFRARDQRYVEFAFNGLLPNVLTIMGTELPGLTHIVIGCTARHTTHAAVARDGNIIHDPATSAGSTILTRACRDGFVRIGIIAVAL